MNVRTTTQTPLGPAALWCRAFAWLWLSMGASTSLGHEKLPHEEQIVAWLRELKPLPKIHYSWPVPVEKLSDELLFEYARLTHAISLNGQYGTANEAHRAVRICKELNRTGPDIPATIAINYSIWKPQFIKDMPPNDRGKAFETEYALFQKNMTSMRDAIDAANTKLRTKVATSAVLFDSETYRTRENNAQWNRAMTAKYNLAYDTAKSLFPEARIEWYARGAVYRSASPTGWSEATYFALDEKGESFGCSLYKVPEIGYSRETFRRTAENAAKHGCDEVTPWIALAAGYRRQVDKFHEFDFDWNYDLIYSWQLGAEVNHPWFSRPEREARFAPWDKAKVVVFYPEPFGRSPHWSTHFVAYVRGAHLVKELPGVIESADGTGIESLVPR